jgi:hypothetical protein
MNRPSPIVFFSLGAVVDFALGSIKWHSVFAGLIAIVSGLPLTAVLFLAFRASGKSNENRDSTG